MTIEEVARRDPPSCGSPDTDDFRKNFERECLENTLNIKTYATHGVPRRLSVSSRVV